MSTSYGWRCVDCEIDSEVYGNARASTLAALSDAGAPIKAARDADDLGYLEISVLGIYHDEQSPIDFLVEHAGHRLILRDEYGRHYAIRDRRPVLDVELPVMDAAP